MAAPSNRGIRVASRMINKRIVWGTQGMKNVRLELKRQQFSPQLKFRREIHMVPRRCMTYDLDDKKLNLAAKPMVFAFDTHGLVKFLTENGFSTEQAEALTIALVQTMTSNQEKQTQTMVTKAQQEIAKQEIMTHLGALRKDMIILERSEFSTLKHENEKQKLEINQLKQQLQDDLDKLKGSVLLDLNLERSRAKEAHAQNETQLAHLDNRIAREVANLTAKFEGYRNDMFKYSAGM